MNDNAAIFSEASYSFDIPEDATPGSQVGQLEAFDADEGVNGRITYAVLSDWGNDVFTLNPDSGVFTLTSRLDYEQVNKLCSFRLVGLNAESHRAREKRLKTVKLNAIKHFLKGVA